MKSMTIGKLAKQTGVGIETIRFYERRGLMKPTERTVSGYRLYDAEAVKRMTFIKGARELGFSLREIKELLALRVDSKATRSDVRQHIREKITTVQQKIAALTGIQQTLDVLLKSCDGDGDAGHCPILEAFEQKGRTIKTKS